MLPTTRATISAAAAAFIAAGGFLGTRYLAVTVLVMIVVLALGWPALLRASRRRSASVILAVGGGLAVVAVVLGRSAPHLRHMVIAVALMVIAALVAEVFLPSSRGRAVTSVAATCAGAIVVGSGAAWVAASRTHGAEDLVVAGGTALAVAAITNVVTRSPQVNSILALVLATASGFAVGMVLPELPWYAGAGIGLLCGVIVTLLQELMRREPRAKGWLPGMSSALAPVLSAGVLVYVGGRLLVG
ncbi:hypothetical protein [Demequina mangrovi]|uniref:Uncharacterized protein n=1 Tax=Demequina mangrovi TaxID=1043493 RepID=A0A1H6WAV2_9MICO|nr:hypothetical protein [Demequina mangrovi]SEJ09940.1 hypothetical protein SAMN05421637_0769 [Demequina mangrovi]